MSTNSGPLTGKTIGSYEVKEVIGRGGMSTVYKAYQPDLEREAALKIIAPHYISADFLARFNLEAQITGQLQHPHILPVYEQGLYEDQPYIITAYLSGKTLADKMKQGFIPVADIVRYLRQIAEALDYAHSKQLVHRDVKPTNILLDSSNNAYLADFGVVKAQESSMNLTGSATIGTPHYMAPELVLQEGTVTPLVDIYALGVTAFELFTTTFPYTGDTPLQVVMQHVNTPVPDLSNLRPDLPPGISNVVGKAMAKEPRDRYQSASEFVTELEIAALSRHRRPTDVQDDGARTLPMGDLKPLNQITQAVEKSSNFQIPVQAIVASIAAIVVAVSLLTTSGALGTVSVADAEVVAPYITAGGSAISVSGIALSHDGEFCAAPGAENKIIIWNTETGEKIHSLEGNSSAPQAVVFSDDGSLVASGAEDAKIVVWSTLTGETLQEFQGHSDSVMSVIFTPDGTELLSGSADGTVRLWDIESGNELLVIETGFGVRSAEFSPDLTVIAVAAADDTVTIYDADNGELVQELAGHQAELKSVSFSPDGRILASASEDGSIVLWDINTGDAINEFSPGEDAMNAMAFSSDGETIIASGPNGQAMEFSAETGAMQRQFDVDEHDIVSMTMSENGEVVAASTAEGDVFMFKRDL